MVPEDCFNVFYQHMHKDAHSQYELKGVASHQSAFIFLEISCLVGNKFT